ncbi:MAG: site-specific integrase [Alphaproteobacteria bacterium]
MRSTGSIRPRTNGSFEIRYDLGVDPLTGKRKRLHKTIRGTYKDAEKELRRLLYSIDQGEHIEPSKITVSQFLKQWLETITSQVSPKTHERYSEIVNNSLVPVFGSYQLTKLSPSIIQQAYNKWETSGRKDSKKGGLSPRTRLHYHRIFSSALKHAVQLQIIARNPADAVKAPRVKKTTVTTITIEQSSQLLDAFQALHSHLYWPVLLALTTGMRRGEIAALRWRNVDFDKSTIRVVESVEQVKHVIRFKAPKTEKTRAVIVPNYAVEELKAWQEKQKERLLELGVEANEDTFVCGRSWDGGVVKPDSLTAEFRKAIRDIPNFPIVRFHDLRHSHATQLLKEGVHPKIAQERLGHSTITTTLDLYSHVTETMQNDAAEKLDSAYRSAIKPRFKSGPKPG